MKRKPNVGGQAVIEGVMMRGPSGETAVAVRQPDGSIAVEHLAANSVTQKYPWLKTPFIRGIVVLCESLALGMKALSKSAQMSGEEDEQVSGGEMVLTIIVSVALAIGLFIILPTWSVNFLHSLTQNSIILNFLEGLLRIGIFLAYVGAISTMKDIRRIFEYHGAEHKTIYAYEAGLPLVPASARGFTTLHPRCGTNFLMIVMLISIFVFTFTGWPDLVSRITSRIILMPVIAGVSYEIIRFAGAHFDRAWVRTAILPGLYLQKLTTREPDDQQLEVAMAALKAVLPADEVVGMQEANTENMECAGVRQDAV